MRASLFANYGVEHTVVEKLLSLTSLELEIYFASDSSHAWGTEQSLCVYTSRSKVPEYNENTRSVNIDESVGTHIILRHAMAFRTRTKETVNISIRPRPCVRAIFTVGLSMRVREPTFCAHAIRNCS